MSSQMGKKIILAALVTVIFAASLLSIWMIGTKQNKIVREEVKMKRNASNINIPPHTFPKLAPERSSMERDASSSMLTESKKLELWNQGLLALQDAGLNLTHYNLVKWIIVDDEVTLKIFFQDNTVNKDAVVRFDGKRNEVARVRLPDSDFLIDPWMIKNLDEAKKQSLTLKSLNELKSSGVNIPEDFTPYFRRDGDLIVVSWQGVRSGKSVSPGVQSCFSIDDFSFKGNSMGGH